ncbi:Brain-enriched guanylate kinase-associated protein [Danaus plexippus plexippus]|uniref:Brain-enriched guanylate kinase-associated protein n=1 Tax=Danaus plexippus plexippus TaxID=278856 RepID=A0A212F8T3_DANPL|nr:Brain-enriched guanylate kinase-associated protein [Danaus plexippus plexippus]
MDEIIKNSPCKECSAGEVQLHKEVDHLRQHLADRDEQFVALETEYFKCTSRVNDLEEQVATWTEKYERLYDSHKRVQKLNQVLEDKLLQMVDKMKSEKSQLTKDIATLSVRLAESKHNYSMLQKENERYKNDMNLAIQLLQCKPDNFVSQKLDNLPIDTQARVSQYVMSKAPKPVNQTKNGNDLDTFDASEYEFNISASLMSKILEDSIQDSVTKHCDTCTCSKSQNKPFCYNESYYTVSTQTIQSGDLSNTLCLNCNAEIKSLHSALSIRSNTPPAIRHVNEKIVNEKPAYNPGYIIPQLTVKPDIRDPAIKKPNNIINDAIKNEGMTKLDVNRKNDVLYKVEDDFKIRANSVTTEPAVHHKLCDRTKTSISSIKSSIQSVGNEDLLVREASNSKETNNKIPIDMNMKKSSHGSMGAGSVTSSVAKSTVSTHKSNTHVGPGPRFCHLRMQAGSKNILLDNAEPDVPPVLYRRQSKCNDNSLFKDLNDLNELDNFIDLEKNDEETKRILKNDNIVVESTLIDVHVDNNNKESNASVKSTPINPVLLNVSSSPLQPQKTHNFSNTSDNKNTSQIGSQNNTSDIDLLNDFNLENSFSRNNNSNSESTTKPDFLSPTDNKDIKIFNFDKYEQSKVTGSFPRTLNKIEMSQLHSMENTKISKDFPPIDGELEKNDTAKSSTIQNIVNVYPNLTQTHLKANDSKKAFTNEQSTSSLSSDDSAALLQKQQLLRVAEWVEKNLEQQNNLNDPLEDDCSLANRMLRRESKINRLTETLNELALNMPHPVTKFAKSFSREPRNNWPHNAASQSLNQEKTNKNNSSNTKIVNKLVKETIFPVEVGDETVTEISENTQNNHAISIDVGKELRDVLKTKGEKEISPEDLARMEYNVKKFLLSGPCWVNNASSGRSRRTSSKTETDV